MTKGEKTVKTVSEGTSSALQRHVFFLQLVTRVYFSYKDELWTQVLVSISVGCSVVFYLSRFRSHFPAYLQNKHSEADAQSTFVSLSTERTRCCQVSPGNIFNMFAKNAKAATKMKTWRWSCLCMMQSSVVFTMHRTMLTLCGKATGQFLQLSLYEWVPHGPRLVFN